MTRRPPGSKLRDMIDSAIRRANALNAAVALGQTLGLGCADALVLKDSNNTIIHLAPAPVIAKVGTSTLRSDAAFVLARELDVGQFLADRGAPIAEPTPDAPPGPHLQNGITITLWTYYKHVLEPTPSEEYLAHMLSEFHEAFVGYPGELPDFTDNLTRARDALGDASRAPALPDADRAFLIDIAADLDTHLQDFDIDAQPLHGEPHLDGNILQTNRGPLLIDFEGACVGPYEWDLTSLEPARPRYPGVNSDLIAGLSRMRSLCVTTWCWMQYGRAPEVNEAAHVHLRYLRAGGRT